MFYKIYQKLFFIFLFSFVTLCNSSALNNNQNLFVQDLPVFCFLNNAKESIEHLQQQECLPDKPIQILEDVNTLLDLTESIIHRFENGMFSYNPGIWYQFLKICQSFKTINELNPADIRDLAEKINSFNKKLNLYFKIRKQFFNESEISLCNDIKAFNLLLLGEVLKDDFLQFSFSEKLLDYIYYQPKKFIEEYRGFFIAGGIVGVGILASFIIPYLKRMFSDEKDPKSKESGCLSVKNPDVTSEDLIVNSGLRNLGNTCYMNSGLQCFINSMSYKFKEFLISNKEEFKDSRVIFNFIEVLENLRKSERAYVPKEFFETAIPKFFRDQQPYRLYKQQDSSEFITKLSGEIINECWAKGLEVKDFDIVLKRKSTCSGCKKEDHISVDNAKSLDVQLPIGLKEISLNECIEAFSAEEEIERKCPYGCGGVEACSNLEIDTCPEILRVNLKRFRFTESGVTEKNRTPVLFNSNELELHAAKYQLTSFICHSGSNASGGHYFSFVRNPELNQWFLYNDSIRTEISDERIKQIISDDGNAGGAEPYVLFFKKKK